jgi:hypothetical protein
VARPSFFACPKREELRTGSKDGYPTRKALETGFGTRRSRVYNAREIRSLVRTLRWIPFVRQSEPRLKVSPCRF